VGRNIHRGSSVAPLLTTVGIVVIVVVAASACGDDPAAPPETNKVQSESSQGCIKTDAPKGVLAKQTINVRGDQRTYDLVVPDSYDSKKAYPLVFVFHGAGGDGAGVRGQYGLEASAGGKAIFVYPDGFLGKWEREKPSESNPDMEYFDVLLESLFASHCVDVQRVFAAGYSNGGYFANQLACSRGARLKAIASISGGGPIGDASDFDDKGNLRCKEKPVAALITHGTDDTEVKLEEGQKSRDHWRRVNGCRTGAGVPFDPAPCVSLAGCASDRPVVYCEVPSIGHALWSESAKATWRFFDSF
jgi:polyhydroxybutyrate depolymerase